MKKLCAIIIALSILVWGGVCFGSEGTKVTDKTALEAAPAMNDVFYMVDVSESGVTGSKKIEIEYLRLSGVSEYASGTTATITFSSIDMPVLELSSGVTVVLVMSGLPTAGTGARIYYLTVVNAYGTTQIQWPTDCVWPGGVEVQPTSGTSNTVDIFPFLYGLESGETKYMLTPIKDLK